MKTITCKDCGSEMDLGVHKNAAGYYLGYWCLYCGPYDRVSGYYQSSGQAMEALDKVREGGAE